MTCRTNGPATFWSQKPGGNTYWRCSVPASRLDAQVLQLRFDDLVEHETHIEMPRHTGTAVWPFAGNSARGILMAAQRAAGVRVLLEVDDNYLIQSPQIPGRGGEWTRKISKDGGHSIEEHRRILENCCDGVIVTTETLADAYRQHTDHVYVCRNSVAPEDWQPVVKPDDGIFRIGYTASHSHWFDAEDVERALSWAAYQPNVEVMIFGLRRQWSFPVTYVDWTDDLAVYRKSLQILDVGVCPLRPGWWADCKSEIKVFEHSMSGVASIVAARPPYADWVDCPEALTARTPKEFLKQVKWLVNNQDAARTLADAAQTRILQERTIDHEIGKWGAALNG